MGEEGVLGSGSGRPAIIIRENSHSVTSSPGTQQPHLQCEWRRKQLHLQCSKRMAWQTHAQKQEVAINALKRDLQEKEQQLQTWQTIHAKKLQRLEKLEDENAQLKGEIERLQSAHEEALHQSCLRNGSLRREARRHSEARSQAKEQLKHKDERIRHLHEIAAGERARFENQKEALDKKNRLLRVALRENEQRKLEVRMLQEVLKEREQQCAGLVQALREGQQRLANMERILKSRIDTLRMRTIESLKRQLVQTKQEVQRSILEMRGTTEQLCMLMRSQQRMLVRKDEEVRRCRQELSRLCWELQRATGRGRRHRTGGQMRDQDSDRASSHWDGSG